MNVVPPVLKSFVVVYVFVSLPMAARAGNITLNPVADTSLFESTPDFNSGQSSLVAGRTRNSTLGRARAVLKFDPGAVLPPGAVVTSASLTLTIVHTPSGGAVDSTLGLHRVLQDWGEGVQSGGGGGGPAITNEATWNSRFHGVAVWATPGGSNGVDFVATVSSTTLVPAFGTITFPSAPDMIADVQQWIDSPGTNFGWMLFSLDEVTLGTARRFAGREDPVSRPQLEIVYLVPARIEEIIRSNEVTRLTIATASNQTHRVEWNDTLVGVPWIELTNLTASPLNTMVQVEDITEFPTRFYRVVSP